MTTTTAGLPELDPTIDAYAKDLEAELTYDMTGTGTNPKAEDVFIKYLPENLTFDQVKQSQDALLTYAAAQTLAHSRKSQAVVTPEQPTTTLRTQIGHTRFESSYDRERSGTAMGKPWKKHGVVSTDVTLGVGRKNSNYKNVVAYSGAAAAAAFSN